ncbi:hypothetical protein PFMG_01458 [Plasmodium falciparum IGH-CR14]|uniref:Uncharacterized protein n=1 Tax=Plasmodium falciparum IGH-CR14 TaxID=580059 RepID=A0A0L1I8G5_PLAFA|nr:hypothetical protein PFMG_01458 [Plasmodium falciparum IGH-CR14]
MNAISLGKINEQIRPLLWKNNSYILNSFTNYTTANETTYGILRIGEFSRD